VRQDVLKFRQHDEGLCGLYTIVNALSALIHERMTHVKGAVLVSRLAEAVPGDLSAIIREGTDRAQMEAMLDAARAWTGEQGWPAWTCRTMHPVHGDHSHPFWDAVATALKGRTAIALVGFGDYHKESTYYEPHWTCVERVAPLTLFLRDSDEYTRIPRAETGIRPEDGWEIEDCFILERPASPV
jgi:hypothetical protein